jgi:hypothetical protein
MEFADKHEMMDILVNKDVNVYKESEHSFVASVVARDDPTVLRGF